MEHLNKRACEILSYVISILADNLNPSKIILFGSRAKEKFPQHADFDLAVDGEKPEIRKRRKIMEEIEGVCGLYGIDLVFLGSVDKRFKYIILNTGKVVYERGS